MQQTSPSNSKKKPKPLEELLWRFESDMSVKSCGYILDILSREGFTESLLQQPNTSAMQLSQPDADALVLYMWMGECMSPVLLVISSKDIIVIANDLGDLHRATRLIHEASNYAQSLAADLYQAYITSANALRDSNGSMTREAVAQALRHLGSFDHMRGWLWGSDSLFRAITGSPIGPRWPPIKK